MTDLRHILPRLLRPASQAAERRAQGLGVLAPHPGVDDVRLGPAAHLPGAAQRARRHAERERGERRAPAHRAGPQPRHVAEYPSPVSLAR